jgi:hypothetical protein
MFSQMFDIDGETILSNDSFVENNLTDTFTVIDTDWIRSMYMTPGRYIEDDLRKKMYSTSADKKISSSGLGNNWSINPLPQYCRFADPRSPGGRHRNEYSVGPATDIGMGIYYSEAIDDNSYNLHLEMGVPKFNNIFTFMSRAIDYKTVTIANTGRYPQGYDLGKFVGAVAVFIMFPVITLAVWLISEVATFLSGSSSFQYYYMKPTMLTYWQAVNNLANSFSTSIGLTMMEDPERVSGDIGLQTKIPEQYMEDIKKWYPDIFTDDGSIDVFSLASRMQKQASKRTKDILECAKTDDCKTFKDHISDTATFVMESPTTLWEWINKTLYEDNKIKDYEIPDDSEKVVDKPKSSEDAVDLKEQSDGSYNLYPGEEEDRERQSIMDSFLAGVQGGAKYAIFRTDFVGEGTYNVSNSTSEIPLEGKLKGLAAAARTMRFSFADGNIAGDEMGMLTNNIKDTLAGFADSVSFGLSGMVGMMTGGAYMDLPAYWSDTNVTLPTYTYKVSLRSPYGNAISRMINIYTPLSMLLAAALPLSAGPAGYTSPFLLSAFMKGVTNIRMGMITNFDLSIATSNLKYNRNKIPLGFDVTFTITDFTKMTTTPVDASIFGGTYRAGLNDESPMNRFISSMTSVDISSMGVANKLKLRWSRLVSDFNTTFSAHGLAARAGMFLEPTAGIFFTPSEMAIGDRNI